jgi:hypothetical protein
LRDEAARLRHEAKANPEKKIEITKTKPGERRAAAAAARSSAHAPQGTGLVLGRLRGMGGALPGWQLRPVFFFNCL